MAGAEAFTATNQLLHRLSKAIDRLSGSQDGQRLMQHCVDWGLAIAPDRSLFFLSDSMTEFPACQINAHKISRILRKNNKAAQEVAAASRRQKGLCSFIFSFFSSRNMAIAGR